MGGLCNLSGQRKSGVQYFVDIQNLPRIRVEMIARGSEDTANCCCTCLPVGDGRLSSGHVTVDCGCEFIFACTWKQACQIQLNTPPEHFSLPLATDLTPHKCLSAAQLLKQLSLAQAYSTFCVKSLFVILDRRLGLDVPDGCR